MKLLKVAAVAAALFSTAAQAQVIGVIDSTIHPRTNISNGTVEVIDRGENAPSANTSFGNTHGNVTIKAIERELDGASIKVIYASPFAVSSKGGNFMRVDWDRAIRNLEVMHQKGAKMVCTTFVTNEKEEATRFVEAANKLGMTVVASLGNGEVSTPYPAMLPGVVAVLRSDYQGGKHADLIARADYFETGKGLRKGGESVTGSSFAAARVCGQLAKKLAN